VTSHELRRPGRTGGRDSEILTFDGDDRILRTEVYFGWDAI